MDLPTVENINDRRKTDFQQRLREALAAENDPERDLYRRLVAEVAQADDVDPLDVAAAVVRLAQGEQSMLLDKPARPERRDRDVPRRERPERSERPERPRKPKGQGPENEGDMPPMDTFRIAVGHQHNVEPRNIVGAIANEAGLDSAYIGRIDIREDYSLVDLPAGMPKDIFKDLKKTWVAGQQLQIRRWSEHPPQRSDADDQRGPGRPGPKRPPKAGRGKPPRPGPRGKAPRS
jgi:ATP-dependent RNA helicase DeaD